MFVETSQQKSFFDLEFNLPDKMLKRIKKTWAEVFLLFIIPLLIKEEKNFADLYSDKGSPNTSVCLLLGILILKEIFDFTDEETLQQLEFNILWQHALNVRFEEAHICRKTLHNFRKKMLGSERHRKLFGSVTKSIIELFGLKTGEQRLDSTHIVGNIKIVSRLGLFVQVIEQFLFKLKRMAGKDPKIAEYIKNLPEYFHKRYLEREGYFSDSRSSQASRKLQTCAEDIWYLLSIFETISKISDLKQYKNLKRLFKDQCEVSEINNNEKIQLQIEIKPVNENKDFSEKKKQNKEPVHSEEQSREIEGNENFSKKNGDKNPTIKVKNKTEISSDSLQSGSDTTATYGHKGKGYEFQIAETCEEENSFQVITETKLNGANVSDQTQTIPMIDKIKEAGIQLTELKVDAGYVSGKNIVKAEEKDVELLGPLQGKAPDPEKITLADFEFNQDGTDVKQCPNGKIPIDQGNSEDGSYSYAQFSEHDCSGCPFQDECPVNGKSNKRLTFSKEQQAIDKRREEVKTEEFKESYKIRSGIEATNSELKNKHGAARLRVREYDPIDFTMVMKSLSLNIKRMFQYVLSQNKVRTCAAQTTRIPIIFLLIFLFFAIRGFFKIKKRSFFIIKEIRNLQFIIRRFC